MLAALVTFVVFVVVDLIWLTGIARGHYVEAMGPLLRTDVNLFAAAAFYLLYVAGIVYFAVFPGGQAADWQRAAVNGAILGLVAYGTYDLTALAVVKGWPTGMSLVDMAWGTALTAAAAVAGATTAQSLA